MEADITRVGEGEWMGDYGCWGGEVGSSSVVGIFVDSLIHAWILGSKTKCLCALDVKKKVCFTYV